MGYTLQKIAHLRADAEAAGRKSETEHLSTLPVASYGTADKLQAAGAGRSQVENASKTTSPLLDDPGLVEIAVASVHQPESDAQKHESEVGEAPSKPQQQKSYMKYWQFQVGLALMAIGAVAAAFVFGLAPQVRWASSCSRLACTLAVCCCVPIRVSRSLRMRLELWNTVLLCVCVCLSAFAICGLFCDCLMVINVCVCLCLCMHRSLRWPRWAQ